MLFNVILIVTSSALHLRLCAADQCSWTGSGLSAGVDTKTVLQVRLRCTEGSVRWVYPGQALRVVLEPNLSYARRSTVCIKASPSLRGATVFFERSGRLEVVVMEQGGRPERIFCFRAHEAHRPVLYVQANLRSDEPWSRRTAGFRYELLGNRTSGPHTSCRPCTDTELLVAVCSSDFVIRGVITNVSHDVVRQTSLVEVSVGRLYWQRSGVFEPRAAASGSPASTPSWRGGIRTLLQCHVRPGDGEFLFTGWEHFGEAWLGCAPRFKDFLSMYQAAWAARRHSCDFPLD